MSSISRHISATFQNVFKTYLLSLFLGILETFQNKTLPTKSGIPIRFSKVVNNGSRILVELDSYFPRSVINIQSWFWFMTGVITYKTVEFTWDTRRRNVFSTDYPHLLKFIHVLVYRDGFQNCLYWFRWTGFGCNCLTAGKRALASFLAAGKGFLVSLRRNGQWHLIQ